MCTAHPATTTLRHLWTTGLSRSVIAALSLPRAQVAMNSSWNPNITRIRIGWVALCF